MDSRDWDEDLVRLVCLLEKAALVEFANFGSSATRECAAHVRTAGRVSSPELAEAFEMADQLRRGWEAEDEAREEAGAENLQWERVARAPQ